MKNSYTDPITGKFTEGNPGKPKGTKHLTTLVREALKKIGISKDGKEFKYEEALVNQIISKAINDGDTKMIKLIWNYLDGMPNQKIEMEDNTALENRKSLRDIADVLNKRKRNSKTNR